VGTKTSLLAAISSNVKYFAQLVIHHNRLPSLKLPCFDGIHVDTDGGLSIINKFNYLLKCLTGPAFEVVQSFQITEENYS